MLKLTQVQFYSFFHLKSAYARENNKQQTIFQKIHLFNYIIHFGSFNAKTKIFSSKKTKFKKKFPLLEENMSRAPKS